MNVYSPTEAKNHRTTGDDLAIFRRLAKLSVQQPIWLRVGQLIDGVSNQPIPNAHLLIDHHQIHFVGSDRQQPSADQLRPGQREPDAIFSNYSVLPCLIEAHAHMFLDGAPIDFAQREAYLKQPAQWMLTRAQARWHKILQCGVGAIRDAGDKHGVGLALAAEAKKNLGKVSTTSWIDSPGSAIHHRGRYGSFMADPIEDYASPDECVAARVATGSDRIKLLATGIINFKLGRVTTPPQMSAEEVGAFVAAARRHGKQTFAHSSGADGIENCIEGGVTTVEHGFFITVEQLAKMRDRQIAWTPTFAPVQLQFDRAAELGWNSEVSGHLQRIITGHQQMLRRAHEMGVKMIAGSDAGSCGVPHGVGLLQEMHQMQQAGLPPMAVLRAATGESANTLNFAEPIGQIAPGYRTRLIFTQHNPLETVANLQRDKIIWFDDAIFESPNIVSTGEILGSIFFDLSGL